MLPPMTVQPSMPAFDAADIPFGLHSVCRTLSEANATLQRFAWLGDQLAVAVWTRQTREAETVYQQPGHHTLSCYLDGGYRTWSCSPAARDPHVANAQELPSA